jgi:hypothetical protein
MEEASATRREGRAHKRASAGGEKHRWRAALLRGDGGAAVEAVVLGQAAADVAAEKEERERWG